MQNAPLFEGMYIWQIKKIILSSEVRHVTRGDLIIQEQVIGTEMYVILDGTVEARFSQDNDAFTHLRTIHTGELFGEVAPLSGGKRTSDVLAVTDCQLLVLSWHRIDRLTRLYPILAHRLFRNLTRIIGDRLRQTTEYRGAGEHEKGA